MLPRSLRKNISAFLVAIAIQLCAVATDLYYQYRGEILEARHLRTIDIETSFLRSVATEGDSLFAGDRETALTVAYQHTLDLINAGHVGLDPAMVTERQTLINNLAAVIRQQRQIHEHINGLLPKLSTSVQYIHEHHITYLKNLLYRGKKFQDYDTDASSFERSPIKSAPELDIIKAAIAIQNSMLDTFEVFSRLQRGYSPKSVNEDFTEKIELFYKAINTFEDYSLDAQDGLLVEELLINGRIFEDSFRQFIQLEQKHHSLAADLELNKKLFIERTGQQKRAIQQAYREIEFRINLSRYLSLTLGAGMMIALFLIGRRIISSFNNTLRETRRLQTDLAYQVPIHPKEFKEFEIIFNALNSMSRTIHQQVNELEASRAELENRVADRTLELSATNAKLKDEIEERIRSEKERRELEEQLTRAQKMEALGMLAGGVAHDLNNVLSGIVSYPEILLWNLDEDSPMRKPILTIQNAGKKAAEIVEDLLTLARRGVSARDIIRLNDVITEYMKSPEYRRLMSHHRKVTLTTDLDPDLLNIIGSPIHIRKTVMNLVSNAAEAQPDGGEIRIATYNHTFDLPQRGYEEIREGDFVALEVSDRGCGISSEDLDRIFEPFYTKKVMGRSGTGLGMAVVWGAVQDHHGYIDVKSEPDMGTTFYLYFPVTREICPIKSEAIDIAEYIGNGEFVLIVDDIREQREIAASYLEMLNYRTHAVSSGEEAVEYLASHSVDLVLLDMIMDPGMDGLETYQGIVEINSQQKAIIASGFAETDRVRQVQQLGAGQYIKKPYTLEAIGVAVYNELNPP